MPNELRREIPPELDDLMTEGWREHDPRRPVDIPDHTLATGRPCMQGKGTTARLTHGEVVWLGHGATLPSLKKKGVPTVAHASYTLGLRAPQLLVDGSCYAVRGKGRVVATKSVVSVSRRSTRLSDIRAHATETQAPQPCAVANPDAWARVTVAQQGKHMHEDFPFLFCFLLFKFLEFRLISNFSFEL